MAAAGRQVDLGTLYDVIKDCIVPATAPWETAVIHKHKHMTRQNELIADVSRECRAHCRIEAMPHWQVVDTTLFNSRAALLDISSELKVSIMCGLVEVPGNAHYLSESRPTATTRTFAAYFAQSHWYASLCTTDMPQPAVDVTALLRRGATHVVTGIHYKVA